MSGIVEAGNEVGHSNTPFADATWTANETGYFDISGHQVLEANGIERSGEYGTDWGINDKVYWLNVTNAYDADCYQDVNGSSRDTSYPIAFYYENTTAATPGYWRGGSDTIGFLGTGAEYGFIALIFGIMALAGIVGFRFISSGISDVSVSAIIKGVAFVSVWIAFSVMAEPLLVMIPVFGFIFYFFISVLYGLGTINQIGSPGDE